MYRYPRTAFEGGDKTFLVFTSSVDGGDALLTVQNLLHLFVDCLQHVLWTLVEGATVRPGQGHAMNR